MHPEHQELDLSQANESPLHGFRGDAGPDQIPSFPQGLTVAISREAGSRGASIAKRVGDKLGWQVYSQELLEYITQEGTFRQDVLNQLSSQAEIWVEEQFQRLLREQALSRNPTILEMARILLSLSSQGDVVLLGRGAGYLLPRHSTLHVRLVAPREDRIAYMSQWLRLTPEEAEQQVQQRDQRRLEFLTTHFHRKPDEIHCYDMILNTSLLGEDLSAELILTAAQAKREALVA